MAQTNIEDTLYAQMHEQYLKNDNGTTQDTCCHCCPDDHTACFAFVGCCFALLTNNLVYIRYYCKYLQIRESMNILKKLLNFGATIAV